MSIISSIVPAPVSGYYLSGSPDNIESNVYGLIWYVSESGSIAWQHGFEQWKYINSILVKSDGAIIGAGSQRIIDGSYNLKRAYLCQLIE